jgi:hypothetical protein
MRWLTSIALFCLAGSWLFAQDSFAQDPFGADIQAVVKQGAGSSAGRAAWDRLAQAHVKALVPILHGIGGRDTSADNWLRTAFDRVLARAQMMDTSAVPVDALLEFARSPKHNGRARRLALDTVEQFRPGAAAKLYPVWLEDPEFRYEAVATVLDGARRALKEKNKSAAAEGFEKAFPAARDIQQARAAAAGLEALGTKVSVGKHLGFLMDWHLIGPFDGGGQKGCHLSYPPEQKVDLSAELSGQADKKLRWVRYRVAEPPHQSGGRHQALVNLREKDALGDADDAVAFAYAEFVVSQAMAAEMRGAADDNLTVWVNGTKVFGFEEWRNGVRHDRHRFPVSLKTGKNTVLVKICQSAAPNPEPNWEFFLRVVDATGRGIVLSDQ